MNEKITKFDEIGSEYWKADLKEDANVTIKGAVFTASGRSAQSLIIQSAEIENRRALLPAYTCQHIVEPFDWNGWKVDFYDINRDLTPNVDSFKKKLALNPGCIIIEGYYSFATAENIIPFLKEAQSSGTVIIEDITHSFLNQTQRIYADADYEFCSLRKWSGLSDGGYAISLRGKKLLTPQKTMETFADERHMAREVKEEYVKTLDPNKKIRYLELYGKAEELLDQDINIYAMSSQAYDDFCHLDFDYIKSRRRSNFQYLLTHIKSPYVYPVFTELPFGVVPIMFPVYIPEFRDSIRKELIENRIYCPVHWPAPVQLDVAAREKSENIYNQIMSIPCDQRYKEQDMKRLVDIINSYGRGE